MAQLLVRNLDDHVKAGLSERAIRHGRSLEAEVRIILSEAVMPPQTGLGTRIAQRFAGIGLDEPIEEWKNLKIKPADFGE